MASRPSEPSLDTKRRNFASRLSLMAVEAVQLGLLRTGHAFTRPQEQNARGETMGPLLVLGFEMEALLCGKQRT